MKRSNESQEGNGAPKRPRAVSWAAAAATGQDLGGTVNPGAHFVNLPPESSIGSLGSALLSSFNAGLERSQAADYPSMGSNTAGGEDLDGEAKGSWLVNQYAEKTITQRGWIESAHGKDQLTVMPIQVGDVVVSLQTDRERPIHMKEAKRHPDALHVLSLQDAMRLMQVVPAKASHVTTAARLYGARPIRARGRNDVLVRVLPGGAQKPELPEEATPKAHATYVLRIQGVCVTAAALGSMNIVVATYGNTIMRNYFGPSVPTGVDLWLRDISHPGNVQDGDEDILPNNPNAAAAAQRLDLGTSKTVMAHPGPDTIKAYTDSVTISALTAEKLGRTAAIVAAAPVTVHAGPGMEIFEIPVELDTQISATSTRREFGAAVLLGKMIEHDKMVPLHDGSAANPHQTSTWGYLRVHLSSHMGSTFDEILAARSV